MKVLGWEVAHKHVAAVLLSCIVSWGCREGMSSEEAKARAAEAERHQKNMRDQAQAAQAAAQAHAKRSAEQARAKKAAQEVQGAKDKMLACCEAIAKKGFEERSMPYMKAFETCEAAHKQGQAFAAVAEGVQRALEGGTLPPQCAQ
jgi:hypothetical protein